MKIEDNTMKKYIEENYQRKIDIKDEYLQLIIDIAYDYDGCNTVKSLKELIDEVISLAEKAIKNDDKSAIYGIGNQQKKNILMEIIE